jgi:archaellum biogenesis ATPase FlaH
MLNKITQGGMARKAVYCVGAQSGGGKSLLMSHVAAATLRQGKNVLYITLEMAEERIAERIDANMLRIDISKLGEMTRDEFTTKIDKVQSKNHGKLFIKEYPTGSAHVGHFRALLEELKVKQGFIPDLIIVDYLGICASSRMKMGGSVNTYSYVKAVAEELRGLSVEYNVPIFTGAQLNRGGFNNSEVELSDTADCIHVDSLVTMKSGEKRRIIDLIPGDQIIDHEMYKTVTMVHHPKKKICYKITTQSGKTLTVSSQHVFPTNYGRLSIDTGLSIGQKLKTLNK